MSDFEQQMRTLATSPGISRAHTKVIAQGVLNMAVPDGRLITTKEAAYSLGVKPGAFRAWARRRGLRATTYRRTHPKGQPSAMWDQDAIAAAAENGIPRAT